MRDSALSLVCRDTTRHVQSTVLPLRADDRSGDRAELGALGELSGTGEREHARNNGILQIARGTPGGFGDFHM